MESFRTRNSSAGQQRLLLLPLSLGLSSVAMLQMLHEQLERQTLKAGRTGFSLHVLHVDTSSVGGDESTDATALQHVKERFPQYPVSTMPLSDAMSSPDFQDLLIQNGMPPQHEDAPSSSNEEKLAHLLSSLPSATARADVASILRQKLIVSFAKEKSCEGIVWGDSTTRLAEKTISETAKGRGFGLAWAVADGPSPHGIDFYYPLRDLLKKELISYSKYVEPPLTPLIVAEKAPSAVVSAKHSSIDELMRGYFEGVERQYPSIVANVVRTTDRLRAPESQATEKTCALCGLPMIGVGVDDGFAVGGSERAQGHGVDLCHGCARSFPQLSR